jgi:hypothetical protein
MHPNAFAALAPQLHLLVLRLPNATACAADHRRWRGGGTTSHGGLGGQASTCMFWLRPMMRAHHLAIGLGNSGEHLFSLLPAFAIVSVLSILDDLGS